MATTSISAEYVKLITVVDPDTNTPVDLQILKLSNGAMVGIDASFLSNTEEPLYSPYDKNVKIKTENL